MRALLLVILCLPPPAPGSADGTIGLPEAVRRAAARSAELASARLDVRESEAQRTAAGLLLLPAFSAAYSRSDSVGYGEPDSRLRKISVSVSHTVFDGGERLRALEAGKRRLGLARRAAAATEEDLAVTVIGKYADILAWRIRRKTLEDAVAAARFQLSLAEEEMRLGETTETDALLAAAEMKDLELELSDAELKEGRSGFEFDKLLGCRDGESLRPLGDIDLGYAGSIDPGDEERYLDAARKRSAAVQELSARVSDLRDAADAAEGGFLPDIVAGLEFSLEGPAFPLSRPGLALRLSFLWDAPEFPLSLSGSAGREGRFRRTRAVDAGFGPVPRSGSPDAGIARARLGLAVHEFADGIEEHCYAVREELAAVGHLRRTAALLRQKVEIREKRLEVLGLMVDIGVAARLELMRERIEVSRTRIAVVEAVMDLFRRETGLLRLCGLPVSGTVSPPLVFPGGGG